MIGTLGMIVGICLLVSLIVYALRRDKRLTKEGKITTRKRGFVEEAVDFILPADPATVAKELQARIYPEMKLTMNIQNGGESISFFCSMGRWRARLFRKGTEGNKTVYCFEFLEWKTDGMITVGDVYMNMLLTAVEKMFLSLDPHTQVQTRLIKTKTKSF